MKPSPVARERRHTLYFLREIRSFSPVFLDTDVDLTDVLHHRAVAQREGSKYSLVTYLLYTSARVLAAHPEANAAISGRIRPRVLRYSSVNGKVTFDKTLNGNRVVLAAVLPGLNLASLPEIQRQVDYYRTGDPQQMPEFAALRILHRLPPPLGAAAFRARVGPLRGRDAVLGTFAITSLGHRPVNGFYSVGGTTITLGLGTAADQAVAREGRVVVAPMMRLSLTFDHRVIDGAEAADVLTEIKAALEDFSTATPFAMSGGDTRLAGELAQTTSTPLDEG